MSHFYGSPDPPRTLYERLERLNDNLQTLGDRLRAAIASVVGDAFADAVRDAVRGLLGGKEGSHDAYRERRDHHTRDYYEGSEDDPWGDGHERWEEERAHAPARQTHTPGKIAGAPWRNAFGSALRAALWFMKRQPRRRPILTTLAVTVAAGVTGFVAGPLLAAGTAVLASVAGLLFTADAAESAAELAAG